MATRQTIVMITLAALAVGCGASSTSAPVPTPTSVTTPTTGVGTSRATPTSTPPTVRETSREPTLAPTIRDCADVDGPAGFTSEQLESTKQEVSTLFGAAEEGEPFIVGVGTGNALELAMVDGVGSFDVLAARLAEVVTETDRVCLATSPFPSRADAGPAAWTLTAAATATDTVLALGVQEQACASGSTAEGRVVVNVRMDEDELRLDVGVVPKPGAQNCQGNPVTPYEVVLDEPVGDRPILDAATGEPATVAPNGPGS